MEHLDRPLPRARPALHFAAISLSLATATACAMALLAFGLRAYAVDYSLPYVDHPDEPNLVTYAVQAMRTGDLNPHAFQKPSLYMYLLLPVFWLHYYFGHASGLYGALSEMAITTHLYTTIPGFFVWGRMLTAALGGLTVLFIYLLGRRVWSPGAGLLGALFIATLPFHMANSQYVTTDVPSAFFVLLSFLAAWSIARSGGWGAYLAAGVLAGLAAATKYNAAVAVVPIATAHLLYWRRQAIVRLPRLAGGAIASILGFLAGVPYALLAWPEFRRGILRQISDYGAGAHGDAIGAWNVAAYTEFFRAEGLRPLAALLLLIGLVALMWRRRAAGLLWLSFAIPYLLLLLSQQSHFWRNLAPLIVLAALPVGVGGVVIWDRIALPIPARLRAPTAALACGVLLLLWLPPALARATSLARPDSRVALQEMLRARYPGVRVAGELDKPLLWNGLAQVTPFQSLSEHPLEWYRAHGYGLLVASSDVRGSYAWKDEYRPLIEDGRLLATYGRPGDGYRGPQLDLIDTGLSSANASSDIPPAQLGPLRLAAVTVGKLADIQAGPELTPGRQLRAGDVLAVTTAWTIAAPVPPASYTIFLHLRDAAGQNLAQRDAPPWLGLFPPHSWQPAQLVVDRLDLSLPATLPPGAYRLVMGLYDPTTQQRFPATVDGAHLPGDELDLGTIEIVP